MVLAYNKALTVKLWRRVTEQCSFYLLMTSAAVLRRLDRDCGAEITWSQLFPTQASPSVSVEEMVDSSCFCVKKKIGSESRLVPYKQLAGGETGSTQEMYVFGKTTRE